MVRLTPDKRPMSMVVQTYALFPHLNVFENVAYGPGLSKIPASELQARVQTALASMGLTAMADRAPSQMSGGQQQRVALARAMVMRQAARPDACRNQAASAGYGHHGAVRHARSG